MRRRWWAASSVAVLALVVWVRFVPVDVRRAGDVSLELRDQDGAVLNVALSHDGMWRLRTRPEDVSPAYLAMLLAVEDRHFATHAGIDPLAMARAMAQFGAHGRVVSGASTLTMQVARLLHPHRHDIAGKLRDMVQAVRLEAQFSKAQILSLYLTLAPFGGNIEGVRAASLLYFGHEPDRLSEAEAALLVALPQSPTRRRPDRHAGVALAAAGRILQREGMPPAVVALAGRRPLPHLAPHLAVRLRLAGLAGPVATTLQAPLQRAVEALAQREAAWSGAGTDIAALIVRERDRAVLAYLGGSDFRARNGMVDMARAVRSPGSALKPFIYGMAIDDGLIRPDTLIEDTKMRIADYAPQDFDHAFHGTVRADVALQQSYNLPAVTLLDWLGASRLAAGLRGAGAAIAVPGGGPATLPLALGGVGMDLWDLTMLYAGLGGGGVVRPLRVVSGEAEGAGTALLTAAGAADILGILRATPRPTGVSAAEARPVAYKTGTSFGFRDGWAFGVSGSATIGVWVGRADGTPRPGAFARETAAPILFRLFDVVPEEGGVAEGARVAEAGPRAPALRLLPARGGRLLEGSAPRIVYPPAGVGLSLAPGANLSLEAAGGVPPYRWAVNGVPLPAPRVGDAAGWRPDGAGFVHVTLTDARERSVAEDVRIR